MRLLVLGGTVFVGRHLVEVALTRGHDVSTFTRARAAGLRVRPIRETVRDTWAWLRGGALDDSAPAPLGLARDKEPAALRAWSTRAA